jgi:hypothetical protein
LKKSKMRLFSDVYHSSGQRVHMYII